MQAVAVVVCAGTGVRARAAGARAASGGAGDAGAGGGSVVHVGEIHTAEHFVPSCAGGVVTRAWVEFTVAGIARLVFAVAAAFGYVATSEKAALIFLGPISFSTAWTWYSRTGKGKEMSYLVPLTTVRGK